MEEFFTNQLKIMNTAPISSLLSKHQGLAQELADFLFALSWMLNHHSDKVTSMSGNKMQICFRPLLSPIGFQRKPETSKSAPCDTPVVIYLLLFLTGNIVLREEEESRKVRDIFFMGISLELQNVLLDGGLEKGSLLCDLLFKILDKQGSLALFKEIREKKTTTTFCYPNPTFVRKIDPYHSEGEKRTWIFLMAKTVFLANHRFIEFNPNLNLGLLNIPVFKK